MFSDERLFRVNNSYWFSFQQQICKTFFTDAHQNDSRLQRLIIWTSMWHGAQLVGLVAVYSHKICTACCNDLFLAINGTLSISTLLISHLFLWSNEERDGHHTPLIKFQHQNYHYDVNNNFNIKIPMCTGIFLTLSFRWNLFLLTWYNNK